MTSIKRPSERTRLVRRALAGFIGLVVSAMGASGAIAQPVMDEETATAAGRSAEALWWDADGRRITYYSLGVSEMFAESPDRPVEYSARLQITPCKRDEVYGVECDYAAETTDRLDVISFEMDPLLISARAVLELDGRRGEVTWAGQGDRSPPIGYYGDESIYPLDYIAVSNSAWVSSERDATARGDLFDLEAAESESNWARMYEAVYAVQRVCVAVESCENSRR